MSPRLAISAAISVMLMAAFALSATHPAAQPFGGGAGDGAIRADLPSPFDWPARFPAWSR